MPTYEYACTSCGTHLEVVQKFTEDALTECPACAGRLRKVFGSIGIAFKGSGFYKTDSRATSSASAKGESQDGDGKKPDGDSAKKKDGDGKKKEGAAAKEGSSTAGDAASGATASGSSGSSSQSATPAKTA